MITGSEDGAIVIYDLVTVGDRRAREEQAERKAALKYHRLPVCSVCQHVARNTLLAGSFDGTISVWD